MYLRGFDEDRLRIRAVEERQGFLELLSPFNRPRFEEMLVERIGAFGPTIAIAPARHRLQDLGAAKVSFQDDEWQQHVSDWIDGARAVDMSATPESVRHGLQWEIRELAEHADDLRLMLVLAPWPRQQLVRRWRAWRDVADDVPPFDGIDAARFPDGVQVLTWSKASGWRAYGSRRRWDWSYSASILRAIEDLDRTASPRKEELTEA